MEKYSDSCKQKSAGDTKFLAVKVINKTKGKKK